MRRKLSGGFELDDDRDRVDIAVVHDFLANESYWAAGRDRAVVDETIREATRVVGLYRVDEPSERMIGFARVVSDGVAFAFLLDVFVLEEFRGRGLGAELAREAVDHGPHATLRWVLGTKDAHAFYKKFGFGPPDRFSMERRSEPPPWAEG